MSVLERYKQRSAYRKSEGLSLSPTETNIYQPSPVGQSPLFASSAGVGEATPVPQLSFTDNPVSSVFADGLETSVMLEETPTAVVACVLPDAQAVIPAQVDAEIDVPPLREPTRIPSTGQKSSGMMFAPRVSGKRTWTHAAMLVLTFLVVLGVLATVVPLTPDGQAQGGNSLLSYIMRWSQGKNGNTVLISPELATATAVMQDGYDPGNVTYAGIPAAPTSGSPNLNRFFYGQCTYYANMEYGSLTGHYVSWLGNANQWVYGARASGWKVSTTPSVPAIIAFDPYVDGAGYFGHVGVTTSINGNQVTYGSWNTAGAPFATTVYLTVTAPAPGVWFITFQ